MRTLRTVAVVAVALLARSLAAQRPTPELRIDSASDAQLQEYFRSLRFLTAHGVTDEQPLIFVDASRTPRVGPIATIQPEEGLAQISPEAFERGLVVARIINHGGDYAPLRLPRKSISYWWVQIGKDYRQSRTMLIATDSATGRILLRTAGQLATLPEEPGVKQYLQPTVRWHFLDGGTRPCFPCPMGWCGFVIMGMGH